MNIFTNNPLRLLSPRYTGFVSRRVSRRTDARTQTATRRNPPLNTAFHTHSRIESSVHTRRARTKRTVMGASESQPLSLSPSLCGTLAARALFWALVHASLFGIRNRNRIIRAHITRTRFGACARECERASECESNNTAERNGTKKSGPAREPARASTAAVRGSENQSEM